MTPQDCPVVPEKNPEIRTAKEWLRERLGAKGVSGEMQIMHCQLFEVRALTALLDDAGVSVQELAETYLAGTNTPF